MRIFVVLDTNVIVSRAITPGGVPGRIVERLAAGDFDLIASEHILAEYRDVLGYDRIRRLHGLSDADIERVIMRIRSEASLIEMLEPIEPAVLADPDDDIFLAAAVAGEAHYIVSGDRHLLDLGSHRGILIVSAAVFLRLLEIETA